VAVFPASASFHGADGCLGGGHSQSQPYQLDSKLQDHKRTQLDRLYQKIVDDLDELLDAVGLKAA
jgi:hypothetical protein